MARNNNLGGLDDPFVTYSKGVKEKVNPKTEQENSTVKLNTQTEQEQLTGSELKQYEQRLSRITKEDTHTRETFLLENSLRARLKEACKGKKKGFKNALLNDAVRDMLEKLEKNQLGNR